MGFFLQAGLGVLPGVIVALILLFKRKAFDISKILISLILVGSCGSMIFFGVKDYEEPVGFSGELSKDEIITFANSLVYQGAYAEAMEVIEEYSDFFGYDDDCRIVMARANLGGGYYEKAAGIYSYLDANELLKDSDELDIVEKIKENKGSDYLAMSYLKGAGAKLSDYGYSDDEYNNFNIEDIMTSSKVNKELKSTLDDQYEFKEEVLKLSKAVNKNSNSNQNNTANSDSYADNYDNYSNDNDDFGSDGNDSLFGNDNGDNSSWTNSESDETDNEAESGRRHRKDKDDDEEDDDDEDESKTALNKLLEENPKYASLDCIKKALLIDLVENERYKDIAKLIDESSSYHELMIASELYMSDLVKSKDFIDRYGSISRSDMSIIKEQLEKVYENYKDDLTVQEKKKLKERIKAVENEMQDVTLSCLKAQLLDSVETAGSDSSKVSLEIARIENYFENSVSADEHITDALYTSQNCKDQSYSVPMGNILEIVQGYDSVGDESKNIPQYVNEALDNSLTINVEDKISPQHQENGDEKDFAKEVRSVPNKIASKLSIGMIDTKNFPNIVARVQITSDRLIDVDDIKKALKVNDCGYDIEDFDLRKLNYEACNILLLCDVSGSMSGNMNNLRETVKAFITEKNEGENIAIVTFNSAIQSQCWFGASDDELYAFAENMNDNGNTNMFGATSECLDRFNAKSTDNNIIILMSDGQDNSKRSSEEIYKELGQKSLNEGVTVYTVGLGDGVDVDYLRTIASACNGVYQFASGPEDLEGLYNDLHGKVQNQYELIYKAKDVNTKLDRELTISLPDENVKTTKVYSLLDDEDNGTGSKGKSGNDLVTKSDGEVTVTGITPGTIYKSLKDQNISIKGSGFKSDIKATLKLDGNVDYDLTGEYVDENTYKVVIPSNIAVGTYNIDIKVGTENKKIVRGLNVVDTGTDGMFVFGPYIFTANNISHSNNNSSHILSGNVTMNGWLHFKGNLNIVGNPDTDDKIYVTDNNGSYVEYSASTARGHALELVNNNLNLSFPKFGGFNLYNDSRQIYDYSNYLVDDISMVNMNIYNLMYILSGLVNIYPDHIDVEVSSLNTKFPLQEQVLSLKGIGDVINTREKCNIMISDTMIGGVIDLEVDTGKQGNFTFVGKPLQFQGEFKTKIDTFKEEYMIGVAVGLDVADYSPGLSGEVTWKRSDNLNKIAVDGVKIGLDVPKPIPFFNVPLTNFDGFNMEISDGLEDAMQKKISWAELKYALGTKISFAKVKDYVPEAEKIVGDLSILEIPDLTASVKLSPFTAEASGSLNFLEKVKLMEQKITVGNFDFTSPLLYVNGVSAKGLEASVKKGIMFESDNGKLKLDVSGEGILDAHNKYVGVTYNGTALIDCSFFLINFEKKKTGDVTIGVHFTESGNHYFVLSFDVDGWFGRKYYYVDSKGHLSKTSGTLT